MTESKFKTAPQPLAPVAFNIPQPFKTALANGLRLVVFSDSRLPLVSFRLAFLTGDIHDPEELSGLTTAMTSLLTEGTENYSSRDIAEKIERLGASVGASSSDDFTTIYASALSLYLDDIVEIMAELTFRPTFPAAELDLFKRNTLENIKFQRSQPNFLANEQTARLLYGRHPYSKVALTPEDVERITENELRLMRERRFIPNNAVMTVVGDVEPDSIVELITDHFGDWERGAVPQPSFPKLPEVKDRTIVLVDRPGSAQANIVIANQGFARDDKDYFAALVMNQVLGAGASSRVFMNLREEKGYTYGAYTRLDTKKLAGGFEATAEVRTPVTGDSLREFFYELERIRTETVGEAELNDAKNFLSGVFPIRAETQEGLTGLLVHQQLYGLPDDYLETYRANIEAVTADDVKAAAEKYVRPSDAAIVIVGDARETLPQVQAYADNVEIYDANGVSKELSTYTASGGSAEPGDLSGDWDIKLEIQGQPVPATLSVRSEDGAFSGKIGTMFGDAEIKTLDINGSSFSATAEAEMQGKSLELSIKGVLDGDVISGSIDTPIIPAPLIFSGRRK